MAFPVLLFPISQTIKDNYYVAGINDSLFDGLNLRLPVSNQGIYVPEFDQPAQAQKGINSTFTPYHRVTPDRFTYTAIDNREEVFWILKQLESDSFVNDTYVPVRCLDYVFPDLADRAAGYSDRLSSQFYVRSEGRYLITENGDKFMSKITLFFEIKRT